MAKPPYIELGQGAEAIRFPILYEDRAVLAIDKPRAWMLVPFTWQRTDRNLQAAIQSSIGAGAFWARSRHLKFLRYVHRLDADTTGVLLFSKSLGGTKSIGDLFESRRMHKRYLAVVRGVPRQGEWTCDLRLDKEPDRIGRMRVDERSGKDAETHFRVIETRGEQTLVEAMPLTGRTHQIRVHLAESGHPVVGDDIYGGAARVPLALRAVELSYEDPFTRRPVRILAPEGGFLAEYGFGPRRLGPVPEAGSMATAGPGSGPSRRAMSPRPQGPPLRPRRSDRETRETRERRGGG